MSFLTRDSILNLKDLTIKPVTFPESLPVWGGQSVYVRQLTRGEQDEYLRRQFGSIRMKQQVARKNASQQEISAPDIYGHDAWLVMKGTCDPEGQPLFKETDIADLNKKSGEAIGWLAKQILDFSNMLEDDAALRKLETDTKN